MVLQAGGAISEYNSHVKMAGLVYLNVSVAAISLGYFQGKGY
jgi:hypothetical protein